MARGGPAGVLHRQAVPVYFGIERRWVYPRLPPLHRWDIGQNFYVDAAYGNDSTGDGSTGAPWQTAQKAADVLTGTATWVAGRDVAVNFRQGTYKASSGTQVTLDIAFTTAARAPAPNRFLIWKPDLGHEGRVRICNPDGTTGPQKGCVRVGTSALNSYQVFYGLDFDGEQQIKGAAGNGNSYAIYLSGNTNGANTAIEILFNKIHGFRGLPGAPSSAQGITTDGNGTAAAHVGGSPWLKIVGNEIYDIGGPGTTDFQEHGMYIHANNALVLGNLSWNIYNGYNCQFYNNNRQDFDGGIVAFNTFDTAEASGLIVHGDTRDFVVVSNIFSNHTGRNSSSFGIELFPAPTGAGARNVIDGNLFFNNGGGNVSSPTTGWTILNSIALDPQFVGYRDGGRTFRLAPGSPALQKGSPLWSPGIDYFSGESRGALPSVGSREAGDTGTLLRPRSRPPQFKSPLMLPERLVERRWELVDAAGPPAIAATSSVSSGAQVASAVTKAVSAASSVSAGAKATSAARKTSQAASAVTGAARAASAGAKGGQVASTASAGARIVSPGAKQAAAVSTTRAGARLTSTGLKAFSGTSLVRAGARVSSTGTAGTPPPNVNASSSVSGGGRIVGVGVKKAVGTGRVIAGVRAGSTGRKAGVTVTAVSAGGLVRSITVKANVGSSRVSAAAFVEATAFSSLSAIVFAAIPAGASRTPVTGRPAAPRTGTTAGPLVGTARKRGVVI